MEDLIKREDAIKIIERCKHRLEGNGSTYQIMLDMIKDIPSAENKGEWKAKSIETYELPEGQIVIEYDASGIGIISRECMEMLVDTLATNKPKQGEWIPCSERLPEDPDPSFTCGSKTYQVTTASGAVVALKWHKTEVRGKTVMRWEYSSGVIYHGDALAWKPLSEPWKGADDE